MSIRKGTELIAGNVNQSTVSTFKLFHHDWFDYSFSDLSWICADDFEWIYGDRYPIAYEHLYADFISTSTYTQETIGSYTIQFKIAPDGHRIVDHANEGIVQNIYGESGVAWYYILDTVNERFKLPRTKHGLSGLRDNVGEYVPESLPNIKGYIEGRGYANNSYAGALTGAGEAFNYTRGGAANTVTPISPTGTQSPADKVALDASTYSSTYQDNAPVQERTTQQYLYFYLCQFPVSALVNPDIAATKVNTNGDNFNSVGRNIANWSSNVSNCITQIPQDIKLELNADTLTLKAGSKGYVPNGFEQDGVTPKFDEVIIGSDVVVNLRTSDGVCSLLYDSTSGNAYASILTQNCSSGSTNPTTGNGYFYNTTTNILTYHASSTYEANLYTLPLGIITISGSTVQIDQVFNGFGYIGSTMFILPNVSGLIANGRNADGTLKSIPWETTSIITRTFETTDTREASLATTGLGIGRAQYKRTIYNETKNLLLNNGDPWYQTFIGSATITNGVISNFRIKTVFHALDDSDADYVIRYQIPTANNNYIWYRLYKSGWVEQGGWFTGTANATAKVITLPIPMSDTNYSGYSVAQCSSATDTGNSQSYRSCFLRTSTTQITVSQTNTWKTQWEVKGFAA